jgi:hypothetical protein
LSTLCRHCFHLVAAGTEWVACHSDDCARVEGGQGRIGPRLMDPARVPGLLERSGLLGRKRRVDLDAPCPHCATRGRLVPVCPRCRAELETARGGDGGGDDAIIAVLGAVDAGKTHYLAALYHCLAEAEEPAGGDVWAVELSEDQRETLRRELWRPLFEERQELEKTPMGRRQEMNLLLRHRQTGRRVLLAFQDLSGEILGERDKIAREEFLRHARGVILLADPLPLQGENDHPSCTRILANYRHLLEQPVRDLDPGEAEQLPLAPGDKTLAIAVTKSDLVLPDEHFFWDPPPLDPVRDGFWEARADEDRAAREWLLERAHRDLVRLAEPFASTGWFFVSSTGFPYEPHSHALPEAPRPRRVVEPLFALLDRFAEEDGHRRHRRHRRRPRTRRRDPQPADSLTETPAFPEPLERPPGPKPRRRSPRREERTVDDAVPTLPEEL